MSAIRSKMIRSLAAATAVLAVALPAVAEAASTSGSLSVTATVTDNCTVSTAPVAFGSINVQGGTSADGSGTITVTCTSGTAWSAAAGVGSSTGANFAVRKLKSGSNFLNYTLYTDSAYGTVWGDGSASSSLITNTGSGAAQSVTIYGRVFSGQASAPVGAYSDTVAVTISY